MKVLIICNLFPPFVMGGAEMAAHSLARWLAGQGHPVRVLTSAPTPPDEGTEVLTDGLTVERRYFENIYQVYKAPPASAPAKLRWHFTDHFHPESERICGEVMDDFQPDVVNSHDLQGIGYNLLKAVGDRDLPCVQTLHDFGFICLSMNQFRGGRECAYHHLSCVASTMIKRSYFKGIKHLAFHSTSAALMERYRPHLPGHAELLASNVPLFFPAVENAAATPRESGRVEFLYAGQLEPWKGIEFLVSVLEELAGAFRFRLTVVGGGSLLEPLRARAARLHWLHIVGKVPPGQVGGHMSGSDLLIVPSLWFENAPLVISQAIELGLPVLGSDTGGVPEMIEAGVNGTLLARGDRQAWKTELERICREPAHLEAWRAGAEKMKGRVSQDQLGEKVLALFRRVRAPGHPNGSVTTRELIS